MKSLTYIPFILKQKNNSLTFSYENVFTVNKININFVLVKITASQNL